MTKFEPVVITTVRPSDLKPGDTVEEVYEERGIWVRIKPRPVPLELPHKPGTVIAIGEWWLVRLRPFQGAPSAWELLPMPSKALTEQAERNGVRSQCIYGNDWVLAEAEQEGGYEIISQPND